MRTSKNWLDALFEHQTTLRSLPGCMTLCDLRSDNYNELVVADLTGLTTDGRAKLKMFKGTTLVSELGLPGLPSAVQSFYIDENSPPVPVIAVAIGPSVLLYRNFKPYYKWTLPSLPIDDNETDIWRKLPTDKTENVPKLMEQLRSIDVKILTDTSLHLLSKSESEQENFIKSHAKTQLKRVSTITAITTLRKSASASCGISYLLMATESGDIYFLDAQTFNIVYEARISSFPVSPNFISATGFFDTDFRVVVSSREGYLCLLRKTWLEGRPILKLENPVLGLSLLPIDQTIIVVCMNQALDCYSKKGKKLWTVSLPQPAMYMVPIGLEHLSQTLVCVALRGGSVQMYGQSVLVDQFMAPSTVSTMAFGRLGQEDHVLVLITVDGSLIVKILKRTAFFNMNSNDNNSVGVHHHSASTPTGNLQIPKKSKVFVEQMTRERDNAPAIYANFQAELWRLRLTAARATVDAIKSADSTISGDIGHAPVKLAAEVMGMGPVFRLFLTLENLATRREAANLAVLLHADNHHYLLERQYTRLPPLVPGYPVKIEFVVTAVLDPNDGLPPSDLTPENAFIRVLVYKIEQAKPLIAATVTMPASEPVDASIY